MIVQDIIKTHNTTETLTYYCVNTMLTQAYYFRNMFSHLECISFLIVSLHITLKHINVRIVKNLLIREKVQIILHTYHV